MEIIGDNGALAICHENDCIQIDDADLKEISKLPKAAAWGYMRRNIRGKLNKNERAILDRWDELGLDLRNARREER